MRDIFFRAVAQAIAVPIVGGRLGGSGKRQASFALPHARFCALAEIEDLSAFIKNGLDGKNIPSCRGDKHGLAPCSPAPGQRIEQAGTGFATRGAATAKIKAPCRDGVPVAADQPRSTTMTIGALARLIMHVPGIDVAEPRL